MNGENPETAEQSAPDNPLAKYRLDPKEQERLARIFTYHPVLPGQAERYEALRGAAHSLAQLISVATPPSRERSLALTKLEEAVMHANAAIARNE
jgi:hypothetical protein